MNSEDTDVAAAYDRWAATYDTDPNKTRELAASVLRQQPISLTNRKVIEIGCGTGLNTSWLSERAGSVVALDFSGEMLAAAKARVSSERVRFIRHDINLEWPVKAATADAIIAVLVLEHIEKLKTVLAEGVRVLRPGGEFFICELHPIRQIRGVKAEFLNGQSGELERVASWPRDVSDYVETAKEFQFEIRDLKEWRCPGDEQPRLMSLHLRLHAGDRGGNN